MSGMQLDWDKPVYPRQEDSNMLLKTLPDDIPFETTAVGPSSMKHIYTGIPNYYPPRQIRRPINSLYGYDFSQRHASGVGTGKRISYHYKTYPLTGMHAREPRVYADYTIPKPDHSQKGEFSDIGPYAHKQF